MVRGFLIHVLERGTSGGGSTGLGLDITRRAAERTGGTMEIGNRPSGGARLVVRFGAATLTSAAPAQREHDISGAAAEMSDAEHAGQVAPHVSSEETAVT